MLSFQTAGLYLTGSLSVVQGTGHTCLMPSLVLWWNFQAQAHGLLIVLFDLWRGRSQKFRLTSLRWKVRQWYLKIQANSFNIYLDTIPLSIAHLLIQDNGGSLISEKLFENSQSLGFSPVNSYLIYLQSYNSFFCN